MKGVREENDRAKDDGHHPPCRLNHILPEPSRTTLRPEYEYTIDEHGVDARRSSTLRFSFELRIEACNKSSIGWAQSAEWTHLAIAASVAAVADEHLDCTGEV
jgi:hypothetical protein